MLIEYLGKKTNSCCCWEWKQGRFRYWNRVQSLTENPVMYLFCVLEWDSCVSLPYLNRDKHCILTGNIFFWKPTSSTSDQVWREPLVLPCILPWNIFFLTIPRHLTYIITPYKAKNGSQVQSKKYLYNWLHSTNQTVCKVNKIFSA